MKNRRAFFVVLIIGMMVFTFVTGMLVMDVQHRGVGFWSLIRFAAAVFLIAIAAEDSLTKEIHDVLLLGLGLVGIGALLLSVVGYGACELSCFSAGSGVGPLQFGFSVPSWTFVGGAGRIVGALCISLPMLAVSVIWRGSFGSGDVLLCAGAGLILGWRLLLYGTAIAMVLAGVLSAVLLLFGMLKRTDSIPFGPFLSIGFLLMLC